MTLNELLEKLEHELIELKNKVSSQDYSQLQEVFHQFKTSVLSMTQSVSESIMQKLDDDDVKKTIDESKRQLNESLSRLQVKLTTLNEQYQLTNSIEETITSVQSKFDLWFSEFKTNHGQQIQSSVEALTHGFKAWVDAKPLEDDIQTLKSKIDEQLQSLKAWIRKG